MLYVQHGVLFKGGFVMVQKEILDLCLERYYDRMIEGIQNNMRIPSVKGKPEAGAPYGKFVNMALEDALGQFTRHYTQTTKRGLLTTNKG